MTDRPAEQQSVWEQDAKLLTDFLSGDVAGLVERFQPMILRYFTMGLSHCDSHTAEDLAQEVWGRVLTRGHAIRRRESFRRWLYRVMHSVAMNHGRGRKMASNLERTELFSIVAPDSDPQQYFLLAERRSLVRVALKNLLPIDIEVLTYFYIDGMSLVGIANTIRDDRHPEGIPVGTVKRLLHTARRRFKSAITALAPSLSEKDSA